nr:MAG TPA_asm: hypothetical protein [Caudoviricetes sp.]
MRLRLLTYCRAIRYKNDKKKRPSIPIPLGNEEHKVLEEQRKSNELFLLWGGAVRLATH